MQAHQQALVGTSAAAVLAALVGPWAATGSASPDSGLHGLVLYGPPCPAQRVGQGCTRLYQAHIGTPGQPTHKLLATARSAADGRFTVRLAPGRYLLRPQPGHPYP